MTRLIDTDKESARYRSASVDATRRSILLTNFLGSEQEKDLTQPPNCQGVGRVRHFRRGSSEDWVPNPLPIDPACKALVLPRTDMLRAQAFQSAACNWRCWYCFVPFNLLSADPRRSVWLSASDLVERYLGEPDRPVMIDLTGGQPDLVPEWVPWMMEALRERGLERSVYLWSDDNLSNDFFWRHLSARDQELIATYPNYGRVCCFKGHDAESFEFNTKAPGELFDRQFDLMRRLVGLGIDIYAYVTFTTPRREGIEEKVARFVDRLQAIDSNLPLRTVPLQVQVFTPVKSRLKLLGGAGEASIEHQYVALDAWRKELERRFPGSIRSLNITEIPLSTRRLIP